MADKPMILLDAAAFCFGPISTLSAILQHLPQGPHEFVLLASGTSRAFARTNLPNVTLVDCDTDSREALLAEADLFREAELFISNTNPVSARVAMEHGARVVYIDTLFWMWDEIDPILFDAEAYIAQDFIGSEQNRSKFYGKIRNFHTVGPLVVDRVEPQEELESSCVVSFGGQQSGLTPLEAIARPARFLAEVIVEAARRANYRGALSFRGNRHVMQLLGSELEAPGREFRCYPHAEHLRTLRRAEIHLLSPGLTGVFEAIENNVPSFLLLGQNYSQELQSQSIKGDIGLRGLFGDGVTWQDVYPSTPVARFLPETEGVRQIQGLWDSLLADPDAAEAYCSRVQGVFEAPQKRCQIPAPTRSGAGEAAGIVDTVLKQAKVVT